MQKTEQRHEALQQELQNAQLGFAQQVAVMQDVHAQVSVLGEVKHYKVPASPQWLSPSVFVCITSMMCVTYVHYCDAHSAR